MLWLLSNYIELAIDTLQNDAAFLDFCAKNAPYRFERTANGKIKIMPPTGFESSERNTELIYQLTKWNRNYKLGRVTESNGGYKLPNSSIKAPDVAWISNEKYNTLSEKDKKGFAPVCPDFVIELRSKTDSVSELKTKMQEYIDNGCQLAWLINCEKQEVHIYKPKQATLIHTDFSKPLSADPILQGFALDLSELV